MPDEADQLRIVRAQPQLPHRVIQIEEIPHRHFPPRQRRAKLLSESFRLGETPDGDRVQQPVAGNRIQQEGLRRTLQRGQQQWFAQTNFHLDRFLLPRSQRGVADRGNVLGRVVRACQRLDSRKQGSRCGSAANTAFKGTAFLLRWERGASVAMGITKSRSSLNR